ncbi:O-antigen ligase family protein [Burkholderia gladioli]|uniref:O-antigen ligase family protein n=1 Tax=Burkholderia gladioli TaxID=28095 RepID=UPI0016413EFC|nr:O-antigen ligase family protein [Burkholderia gladioli]
MQQVNQRTAVDAARESVLQRLVADVVGRPGALWLDAALVLASFAAVLLYMSLRGAANFCLIVLALLSLVDLPAAWRDASHGINRRALLIAALALAAPIISVAVGQALRGEWIARAFDAPSRLLVAVPVLVVFHHKRIDLVRIVGLAAPIALLGLIVQVHFDPHAVAVWGGRYATYFVDTDTFGVYVLMLAMLGAFSVGSAGRVDGSGVRALAWIGLIAGGYLVMGSQTRTAFLLAPIAVVLWFALRRPTLNMKTIGLVLVAVAACVIAFGVFSGAAQRLVSVYTETSQWMNQSNPDTSGGMRLTMWKIAVALFVHNPLRGYGDVGFRAYLDAPWITSFASERARMMIYAGPHNELLANLLRSGIAGGMAVAMLFAVPLVLLMRARRANPRARHTADTGLAFMICLMVACVMFEMFTLKYTATFNALMIAGLLAQALAERAQPDEATAGTASRDA